MQTSHLIHFGLKHYLIELKLIETCFRNEAEIQLKRICFLLNVEHIVLTNNIYTNTEMKIH